MSFERVIAAFRHGFQQQAERTFPGLDIATVMAEVFEWSRRTGNVRDLNAVAWSWCQKRYREASTNHDSREDARRAYAAFLVAVFREVGRGEISPCQVADRFDAASLQFASINPRIAADLRALGGEW